FRTGEDQVCLAVAVEISHRGGTGGTKVWKIRRQDRVLETAATAAPHADPDPRRRHVRKCRLNAEHVRCTVAVPIEGCFEVGLLGVEGAEVCPREMRAPHPRGVGTGTSVGRGGGCPAGTAGTAAATWTARTTATARTGARQSP